MNNPTARPRFSILLWSYPWHIRAWVPSTGPVHLHLAIPQLQGDSSTKMCCCCFSSICIGNFKGPARYQHRRNRQTGPLKARVSYPVMTPMLMEQITFQARLNANPWFAPSKGASQGSVFRGSASWDPMRAWVRILPKTPGYPCKATIRSM